MYYYPRKQNGGSQRKEALARAGSGIITAKLARAAANAMMMREKRD
jgi:hypothetical protein